MKGFSPIPTGSLSTGASRAAWLWALCPPAAIAFGASATRWPSPAAVGIAAAVIAVLVVAALVVARREGR